MSRTRQSSSPPPPDDPIEVLLQELLQHLASGQTAQVERRVEIGRVSLGLKEAMNHGEWLFFVADRLPLSPASVKRAIQLHKFAQGQPERFEQVRTLGLTKAYALMAASPKEFEAFFAVPKHAVRRNIMKTPLEMTFQEMMGVLHGPPKKEPASVVAVKAVKRFAKGLVSSVTALLDLPGFVESEELMDSLETIADETKRVVALLPAALAAG